MRPPDSPQDGLAAAIVATQPLPDSPGAPLPLTVGHAEAAARIVPAQRPWGCDGEAGSAFQARGPRNADRAGVLLPVYPRGTHADEDRGGTGCAGDVLVDLDVVTS